MQLAELLLVLTPVQFVSLLTRSLSVLCVATVALILFDLAPRTLRPSVQTPLLTLPTSLIRLPTRKPTPDRHPRRLEQIAPYSARKSLSPRTTRPRPAEPAGLPLHLRKVRYSLDTSLPNLVLPTLRTTLLIHDAASQSAEQKFP